jgi:hypothetical protein
MHPVALIPIAAIIVVRVGWRLLRTTTRAGGGAPPRDR